MLITNKFRWLKLMWFGVIDAKSLAGIWGWSLLPCVYSQTPTADVLHRVGNFDRIQQVQRNRRRRVVETAVHHDRNLTTYRLRNGTERAGSCAWNVRKQSRMVTVGRWIAQPLSLVPLWNSDELLCQQFLARLDSFPCLFILPCVKIARLRWLVSHELSRSIKAF